MKHTTEHRTLAVSSEIYNKALEKLQFGHVIEAIKLFWKESSNEGISLQDAKRAIDCCRYVRHEVPDEAADGNVYVPILPY